MFLIQYQTFPLDLFVSMLNAKLIVDPFSTKHLTAYKAFQIIFLIPIHFFSRYPPVIFVLPPNGIKSREPHIVAPYSHIL